MSETTWFFPTWYQRGKHGVFLYVKLNWQKLLTSHVATEHLERHQAQWNWNQSNQETFSMSCDHWCVNELQLKKQNCSPKEKDVELSQHSYFSFNLQKTKTNQMNIVYKYACTLLKANIALEHKHSQRQSLTLNTFQGLCLFQGQDCSLPSAVTGNFLWNAFLGMVNWPLFESPINFRNIGSRPLPPHKLPWILGYKGLTSCVCPKLLKHVWGCVHLIYLVEFDYHQIHQIQIHENVRQIQYP